MEKEYPGSNILLHKMNKITKVLSIDRISMNILFANNMLKHVQGFQDIWTNEKMLNLVEQLLGSPQITGNPVWNLRTKTPKNEPTTVPWHQGLEQV